MSGEFHFNSGDFISTSVESGAATAVVVAHSHPTFPEYGKVDEIPFDLSRRMTSIVVKPPDGKHRLICKGAPEEIDKHCCGFELDGRSQPINDATQQALKKEFDRLSADGFRVLARAYRDLEAEAACSKDDECDLTLRGYVAFLDPLKDTIRAAITALQGDGVAVKVLTGDNELALRFDFSPVAIPTDDVDPVTGLSSP